MKLHDALLAMEKGQMVKDSTGYIMRIHEGIIQVCTEHTDWVTSQAAVDILQLRTYTIYQIPPASYFDWAHACLELVKGKTLSRKMWGTLTVIRFDADFDLLKYGNYNPPYGFIPNKADMLTTDWYVVKD